MATIIRASPENPATTTDNVAVTSFDQHALIIEMEHIVYTERWVQRNLHAPAQQIAQPRRAGKNPKQLPPMPAKASRLPPNVAHAASKVISGRTPTRVIITIQDI